MDSIAQIAFALYYAERHSSIGEDYEGLLAEWRQKIWPYRYASHKRNNYEVMRGMKFYIPCKRCEADEYFQLAERIAKESSHGPAND